MRQPILVTGGTGVLGRAVVKQLLAADEPVRVTSRRPKPGHVDHEWATANLRTGEGLREAVEGVSAIVHCANEARLSGSDSMRVTPKLVETAKLAGSPPLVYISIVGIDRIPLGYYRTKLADERLIAESGLPYTILRATQFHDLVRVLFAGAAKLPLMVVPDVRFQPVDAGEVGARLAELALDEPRGRVADMGGPRVRTARELAESYLAASGQRRRVVPVRLPGRSFRALRHGDNLAPDNAVGTITFDQYLAEHPAPTTVSYK